MTLLTPRYANDLLTMHETDPRWGADGAKHTDAVARIANAWDCHTILDYGCGKGRLKASLEHHAFHVDEYDPGIPGKHTPPKGAHLVVCTDVLEHIEPECLGDVLLHLHSLTRRLLYVVIALRPAKKLLPNGDNAHLIVKDFAWWLERLQFVGFWAREANHRPGKEVAMLMLPEEPTSKRGPSRNPLSA